MIKTKIAKATLTKKQANEIPTKTITTNIVEVVFPCHNNIHIVFVIHIVYVICHLPPTPATPVISHLSLSPFQLPSEMFFDYFVFKI